MPENIISWNVPNWITITLMALIGFFLLGIAQKGAQKYRAQTASA